MDHFWDNIVRPKRWDFGGVSSRASSRAFFLLKRQFWRKTMIRKVSEKIYMIICMQRFWKFAMWADMSRAGNPFCFSFFDIFVTAIFWLVLLECIWPRKTDGRQKSPNPNRCLAGRSELSTLNSYVCRLQNRSFGDFSAIGNIGTPTNFNIAKKCQLKRNMTFGSDLAVGHLLLQLGWSFLWLTNSPGVGPVFWIGGVSRSHETVDRKTLLNLCEIFRTKLIPIRT